MEDKFQLHMYFTFKKYEMCKKGFIDDLVHYVVVESAADDQNVNKCSQPMKSGFSRNIGLAIQKLLAHYRRSPFFSQKISQVVNKCSKEKCDYVALKSTIRDEVSGYGSYLLHCSAYNYFLFFAVICELCLKFCASELEFLIPEVKNTANQVLSRYFLTFCGRKKMESFAVEFLKAYHDY